MAETLRIVFSRNTRQRKPAPLLRIEKSAPLSAAMLQLLHAYSRQARQALLQPSRQTMDALMRAVYQG